MNRKLFRQTALCLFATAFLGLTSVVAQDEQPNTISTDTEERVEPLSMEERTAILMKDVGSWDAKIKMWMPGSDEAMEAEGTEVNQMLGDMWIVSEFKGNFFGQEFEGRGQFGYDDTTAKFVGTWIDSMEPYMSKMSGDWDADNNTMTFETEGVDAESGQPRMGKNVVVYESEDSRIMTMWMQDENGDMVKGMEIHYTRQQ